MPHIIPDSPPGVTAALFGKVAEDYQLPMPASVSRREWVVARVAQIRSEFDERAQELAALIRELEGPETQHALPEGWSVIEGDATLTSHAQRPVLTVVAR